MKSSVIRNGRADVPYVCWAPFLLERLWAKKYSASVPRGTVPASAYCSTLSVRMDLYGERSLLHNILRVSKGITTRNNISSASKLSRTLNLLSNESNRAVTAVVDHTIDLHTRSPNMYCAADFVGLFCPHPHWINQETQEAK